MDHRIVKTQFVADLKPGMTADTVFLCADVKSRMTRNGSYFADVRLVDRTGEISLKLWRYSPDATLGLEPGACVRVSNVPVEEYGGSLQLSQDTSSFGRSVALCDVSQCNLADFVPATPRDVDEMTREVLDAVSGVSNKPIRCLLQSFFCDPEFMARFREWPAAIRHHHAYCGGLLEHTVNVLQICRQAAKQYDSVNWDVLCAGALLHDIGKVQSYDYDRARAAAAMSPDGVAVDHIVLGMESVARHITQLVSDCSHRSTCSSQCWTPGLTLEMSHLVASHHGTLEWGSPVQPATIEACILHHADNMDAQVNKFERTLRESFASGEGEYRYSELVGRTVWMPSRSEYRE